jgi:RimJ/RimL family protein N-acetyltransferase
VADELLTARLRLRRWTSEDSGRLAEVFAKPEVWQFPFGRGFNVEETRAFLAHRIAEQATGGWAEWATEHRDSGRLIGYIGLSVPHFLPEVMPTVEVGWRLDPDAWGQGLATEGARAALAHGFSSPDLHEVVSIFEPQNAASGRVMERLGMRFDRDTVHPTRGLALRVYRLSRAQWETMTPHKDKASP